MGVSQEVFDPYHSFLLMDHGDQAELVVTYVKNRVIHVSQRDRFGFGKVFLHIEKLLPLGSFGDPYPEREFTFGLGIFLLFRESF